MSNIQFAMIAPPDKHKELTSEINNWKYEVQGKYFKGKQSPYISEIKFYDVRIPEQIEKEFVRDLGFISLDHGGNKAIKSWKTKLFMKLYKWFLKLLTPYQPLEAAKGERKYNMTGWKYCIPLGKIPRNKMPVETGENREVL